MARPPHLLNNYVALYTTAKDRSKCDTTLAVGHRLCQRTAFPDMGLADDNLRTDAFSHSAPVYCVGPNFFQTHFFAANMDYIFFRQSNSELIFSHVSIHTTCCIWGGFSPGALPGTAL